MSGNAQSVTGNITGTATDSNGALLANVNVTLVSEKTGEFRNTTTNEEGRFNFAAVQPGIYTVKFELQNFQTLEKKNNVLSANETLALGEIPLTAGNVSEVVTVVSEGATIEKDTSDLTARLTSDQIDLISTKGRDVTSLLRLIPGTSNIDDTESVGDGFGTDLPNFSGARARSAVPTVDGLNAGEVSGANKLSMTISQDAVAEVKVLRNNYAAEYGNNGGAVINIVSKGGGKNYRGSAYYFIRNEALNASPFFNNKAGLKKPLYRHNIWGFNVGGPMPLPRFGEGGPVFLKDRAFFFFNYEQPRTITPQDPIFVTVPTALERVGDFSQSVDTNNAKLFIRDPRLTGNCTSADSSGCFRDPSRATTGNPLGLNIIPVSRLNNNGLAFLRYFPLPNANGSNYNYVQQSPIDTPKRSILLRFDFKISDKDNVYIKGQKWRSDNEGTGTSGWPGGDANRWGIRSHYLYKDDGASANWVHIFNSKLVNEFNIGIRRSSEGFIPTDGFVESLQRSVLNYSAPQLYPQNNRLGTIPRATGWTGVRSVAPANINWLDRWAEYGRDYIFPSFSDNFSVSSGNHNYKFGAYYERVKNGEAPGGQWSGVFNFSSNSNIYTTALGNTGHPYANAAIGSFANYQESTTRPFTNLQMTLFQWYAQDQWKINQKLTVNYGARFGYHSPWRQNDGQGSNFDPTLFNPSQTVALYESACVTAIPAGGTCATANRRARNPLTGQLIPLTGVNANLVGTIVPNSGNILNGLALVSDNAASSYRKFRPVDVEPRVGFAYTPFSKQSTVVRGMFGMYYSPRVAGNTGGPLLQNNPPTNRTISIDFGNIDQLTNLTNTSLIPVTGLSAVEVNSHTPASYNYSLGIQQDLGFGTVLEASYVGSVGRHLGQRFNLNNIPDGAKLGNNNIDPVTGGRINDNFLRPYRGYGSITYQTFSGNSNYNSLQVQINRRYANNFQYGLAYTYSKSLDYANDDNADIFNPRPYRAFNYAPSDFDQPHILTINYIWDLPRASRLWNNGFVKAVFDGWQLSGTSTYASGKPKKSVCNLFRCLHARQFRADLS